MVDAATSARANTAAVTRAVFIVFSLGYLKRGSSTRRGSPDTHPHRASMEGRAVRVTTSDKGTSHVRHSGHPAGVTGAVGSSLHRSSHRCPHRHTRWKWSP